jgi:hypothetical protein
MKYNMRKTILFILDSFELYTGRIDLPNKTLCYSYFDTKEAISNNMQHIVTYDIGHLSFDLTDLGYEIFIGYNGKIKYIKEGMTTANGKELRHGHNLRRLLIGGALDNDLYIDRPHFYYDKEKSIPELLADELTKQKIDIISKIANETIGMHIKGTKAMTPEESKKLHETHAYYDKDGHFIISPDPVEYDGINKIKPNIKI